MSSSRRDIAVSQPILGAAEEAAVARVLRSGQLSQGPEVAAFESEFSSGVVGGIHCVAVNSGTSALHLGLLALGIGRGDEVIVPSFTFAATANAVALTGADPVFVDISAESFTIDPRAVEAAVGRRTAAIIAVHLYVHPADMTALRAVADSARVALLEDAAQAHLAGWDGRPVGSIGDLGAFSFYPTKNMTSIEGGMVSCRDDHVRAVIRKLRNQGMERQYDNEVVGLNNRMSDVHAAVGRVQLKRLMEWTTVRQRNAAYYDANLRGVAVPAVSDTATHVYHQYTLRVPDSRSDLRRELADCGIATGVYYPTPVHRLPSFDRELDLPVTEAASAEVLSLPVHPALSDGDLEFIVGAFNAIQHRVLRAS